MRLLIDITMSGPTVEATAKIFVGMCPCQRLDSKLARGRVATLLPFVVLTSILTAKTLTLHWRSEVRCGILALRRLHLRLVWALFRDRRPRLGLTSVIHDESGRERREEEDCEVGETYY